MTALLLLGVVACDEPQLQPTPDTNETYDMTGFVHGADVSWITEQEASGVSFYDADGVQTEGFVLMRELGMNAIRLRVWVDPTDGWCNKEDVLVKAYRANKLGFRLLIDFHYSNEWADPSNQKTPTAWETYNLEEMKEAVAQHTSEVLQMLKDRNVNVEWVQVGNETRYGMLWPLGNTSGGDFSAYAALNNAGYDAVKLIYPDAKVVVHIDRAHQLYGFTNHFNGLQAAGGKWDVIGMSFYPYWDEGYNGENWKEFTDATLQNMATLVQLYSTEVMVVEAGTMWNDIYGELMFQDLITRAKKMTNCLGVFYWEPQSYNSWKSYQLGAFNIDGTPSPIMNAFKR